MRPRVAHALACLLAAGCTMSRSQVPRVPNVDPTLERLHELRGGLTCPAPIARELSTNYFHLVDHEYESHGQFRPPNDAQAQRARAIISGAPEVAEKVFEQFRLERYLEYARPGYPQRPQLVNSAAAQEADWAALMRFMQEAKDIGPGAGEWRGQHAITRVGRIAVLNWLQERDGFVGSTAPAGTQLGVLFLEAFRPPDDATFSVLATLEVPGKPRLQALRHLTHRDLVRFARGAYVLPNHVAAGLDEQYERAKVMRAEQTGIKEWWSAPTPGHHLLALLAVDALFELCIAENVRSGELSPRDFPIPQPSVQRTVETAGAAP